MTLNRRALLGRAALSATAFTLLASPLLSPGALAQAWPAKPIRIVVPFPAGGGTDIVARETSQRVAAATGWTFVIDNKPGAGGNLGVDSVAKSPADGYTLVLGQTSNLAINPTLYPKLPYQPLKDLTPIVLLANAPLVMVTGMNTPYKSLADAVNAARAKPGQINFASPGNGTVAHLTSELFQKAAGVKTQHVPYKGAAQALTDVVSGTVDLYMSAVPTLIGQIRQGKLRPLAVTSAKRVDDLPQVPTINESGYKGFDAVTWFGLLAPAGTPKEVVARLNAEFNKALKQPELAKRLADEGADPAGGTPEQFAELIRQDIPRWGKVVHESGARVD
ncbi:Bug family tripartite tricarboxylate transporter substrate binding protein [Ideonella livida]|uniref:Tripartite tricarboxylate transporter substrate binding protein n=1 Tax=Ideonella livida TaxID=2707176 RepID=A0A7C9TLW1_9BURK|nr:tripartite tricarboxylate transporter substrate binding protein [Ideonella livida]NDY93601.1 tripartite tricarboxylate transporter substrate binding protein [Ideonella livida]